MHLQSLASQPYMFRSSQYVANTRAQALRTSWKPIPFNIFRKMTASNIIVAFKHISPTYLHVRLKPKKHLPPVPTILQQRGMVWIPPRSSPSAQQTQAHLVMRNWAKTQMDHNGPTSSTMFDCLESESSFPCNSVGMLFFRNFSNNWVKFW